MHTTTTTPPSARRPAPGQEPRHRAAATTPAPSADAGLPDGAPQPPLGRRPVGGDRPAQERRPGGGPSGSTVPTARRIAPSGNRGRSSAGPLRRLLLALLAALMLVPTVQMPADAYAHSYASAYVGAPNLYYSRNLSDDQHNGQLRMYYNAMHHGGTIGSRYRIASRGGSGLDNTDDCVRNEGPAPDGVYGRGDNDALSQLTFMNKTWGGEIVRGYVWYMGGKRCSGPGTTQRTALFIHSQRATGWNDRNHRSFGCIKVNQTDRAFMADAYITAYSNGNGRLTVS